MPTIKANSVAIGAILTTIHAPLTTRENTSRARLSPPSRNHWKSPASAPLSGVPGRAFFIPETGLSGSCVISMSNAPPRTPVNTQNITRPKPTMPIVLSNSLP